MSITDAKSSLDLVVREYAFPDIHIGAADDESPWVPFKENSFIRHLAFDVRSNMYANVLWVTKGGMLGRHRHRGRVFGYTVEGSWRYLEYDWIARPGSYVQESPGATHTLVSDEGMKTIFWLNGALEFYDDKENLLETLDVFWFIDHYLSYCRQHNIKVNQKLLGNLPSIFVFSSHRPSPGTAHTAFGAGLDRCGTPTVVRLDSQ
jgi:quercetin dioxygenase-like cupin family protein